MVSALRGQIWWADLPAPRGSGPGHLRPVVVIQSDTFNESPIRTVIVALMTSNLRLAGAPGNVFVDASGEGLARDSVVNVSQLITIDREVLIDWIGELRTWQLSAVAEGLRLVLDL